MSVYNGTLQFIDEQEMRRYAGLSRSKDFPAQLIDDACMEVQVLGAPQGIYHSYAYNCAEAVIISEPPLALNGDTVKRHLRGCSEVIVLAVTIGEATEKGISEHFAAGRYTAAVLLDAAGTTAVEMIADQVNELIKTQAAKRGLSITTRFSPGYGGWDVTAQAAVTALAGGKEIGITVTETSMLEPRKSVTAIIGLRTEDKNNPQKTASGCRICTQPQCHFRRQITDNK